MIEILILLLISFTYADDNCTQFNYCNDCVENIGISGNTCMWLVQSSNYICIDYSNLENFFSFHLAGKFRFDGGIIKPGSILVPFLIHIHNTLPYPPHLLSRMMDQLYPELILNSLQNELMNPFQL